jgi:hypothetical protein
MEVTIPLTISFSNTEVSVESYSSALTLRILLLCKNVHFCSKRTNRNHRGQFQLLPVLLRPLFLLYLPLRLRPYFLLLFLQPRLLLLLLLSLLLLLQPRLLLLLLLPLLPRSPLQLLAFLQFPVFLLPVVLLLLLLRSLFFLLVFFFF